MVPNTRSNCRRLSLHRMRVSSARYDLSEGPWLRRLTFDDLHLQSADLQTHRAWYSRILSNRDELHRYLIAGNDLSHAPKPLYRRRGVHQERHITMSVLRI